MWQPPLPNNGKVRVRISADISTEFFLDHYSTLNIAPVIEKESNKFYLYKMTVNGKYTVPVPKLYLDEHINEVELDYSGDATNFVPAVLAGVGDISIENYLPQIGGTDIISFPTGRIYKGFKLGAYEIDQPVFAFPVDLDKEDFEIWKNGIKFTLRLNRDFKYTQDFISFVIFDIIKAEFYGELLPAKRIDDYVELKPKGD